MPSHEELVITGMTFASSLGCDQESLRSALLTKQPGLSFEHRFQDWLGAPLGELPWEELGIDARDIWNTDAMLQEACHRKLAQLLAETDLLNRYPRARIGLWVGTTTSGIKGFYRGAHAMNSDFGQPAQLLGADLYQACLAQNLAQALQWQGPFWTFCTSCAASAQAFGLGAEAVQSGAIDAAIVIGADILNLTTILGFESLQLLDHSFCKPFDEDRRGINLSEAVVIMSLERRQPEAGQIALRGFQTMTEAYHMTQPAPEGIWMQKTMAAALAQAQLLPEDIVYINPHGTGTRANDSCEATALQQVFGQDHPMHSTKGLTGHPLGASGLLELLITSLMLPTLPAPRRKLGLSNSFGFGGANVCIVVECLS